MIICSNCGKDSVVKDTRKIGSTVRRRRHCADFKNCGHRWTTYEVDSPVVGFITEVFHLVQPLSNAAEGLRAASEDYEIEKHRTLHSLGKKQVSKRKRSRVS